MLGPERKCIESMVQTFHSSAVMTSLSTNEQPAGSGIWRISKHLVKNRDGAVVLAEIKRSAGLGSIDTPSGTCYFFSALTGEVTELAEGGTLLRCVTGNGAGG